MPGPPIKQAMKTRVLLWLLGQRAFMACLCKLSDYVGLQDGSGHPVSSLYITMNRPCQHFKEHSLPGGYTPAWGCSIPVEILNMETAMGMER